eukprot:gnl/MRDRNA2_/MRDRNA2_135863_c0_seq1.p1 gnl/MRDRNA2_/MRDRNA2_135863_c0~~gnl/MRDRNA2_/MRDRNA2_135863_c0_seq1.p1  ORF type:complete len:852 (-),score=109.54 gnl/MRDRNA2_/MRDRNA2_135863_c0_seq1:186-2741(-)
MSYSNVSACELLPPQDDPQDVVLPERCYRYHSLSPSDGPTIHTSGLHIMGAEVYVDDVSWHYVLLFPQLNNANVSYFQQEHIDPGLKRAEQLFTRRCWNGTSGDSELGMKPAKNLYRERMTRLEFHDTSRRKIIDLLTGPKMGFHVAIEKSIDEDQALLLVRMESEEAVKQIANRQGVRMPVKVEAYPPGSCCPTTHYSHRHKGFLWKHKYDLCPLHLPYKKIHAEKYEDFRDVDLIRMIRKRLFEFVNVPAMMAEGIIIDMFPVHNWVELQRFKEIGWSGLTNNKSKTPCALLRNHHVDCMIRDYFGEEVAFFFHWFNFYTVMLILPACFGFLFFWCRHLLVDNDALQLIQLSFAIMMCLWSGFFTKIYRQHENLKIAQWGMADWVQKATVRPYFRPHMQGTWREWFEEAFHWVLLAFFIGETFCAILAISWLQSKALLHYDEDWKVGIFVIRGVSISKIAKLLFTLHIMVVWAIWRWLCPILTARENWRTEQERKASEQVKLFLVGCVMYFCPFWYLAFLKEHIEGCTAIVIGNVSIDNNGCQHELVANIEVFFLCHILYSILSIVVPTLMTRWAIRREFSSANRKSKTGTPYTFLQFQAACSAYNSETDDMMELIMSLGFIMMFSVVLPELALMALVNNLIEIRLLAYKVCHVVRRADPKGQEGIGAWASIVHVIASMGVTCNVALAVFHLYPLKTFSLVQKLGMFIVIERVMLGLKVLVEAIVPEKSVTLKHIERANHDCIDEIFDYAFDGSVQVKSRWPESSDHPKEVPAPDATPALRGHDDSIFTRKASGINIYDLDKAFSVADCLDLSSALQQTSETPISASDAHTNAGSRSTDGDSVRVIIVI